MNDFLNVVDHVVGGVERGVRLGGGNDIALKLESFTYSSLYEKRGLIEGRFQVSE